MHVSDDKSTRTSFLYFSKIWACHTEPLSTDLKPTNSAFKSKHMRKHTAITQFYLDLQFALLHKYNTDELQSILATSEKLYIEMDMRGKHI